METNVLQTLTGTGPTGDTRKGHTDKADGDAFSACLDDASHTKADAGKANASMIDDGGKKKESTSKKEAAKGESAAEAAKAADKVGAAKLTPAMKKLMHVNPETLSLADRQAMRVGEFSREQEAVRANHHPMGVHQQSFVGGSISRMPFGALANAERASDGKLEIASKAALDKALDRSEEDGVKDHKSKHVSQEHNDFHHSGLEQLLSQEVAKTEDVNKADQQKAYEQRQIVLDQIIKHVEVRNFQNQTEMNLRLNPEYLGELKINMQHTKEGGVTTTIQTSSRVTRKLLEDSKDELAEQASKNGIRLGTLKVSLVDSFT